MVFNDTSTTQSNCKRWMQCEKKTWTKARFMKFWTFKLYGWSEKYMNELLMVYAIENLFVFIRKWQCHGLSSNNEAFLGKNFIKSDTCAASESILRFYAHKLCNRTRKKCDACVTSHAYLLWHCQTSLTHVCTLIIIMEIWPCKGNG